MRKAYIASGALHLGVIALAFWGLPQIFRPEPIETQIVNVEVVSLKDAAPKPEPVKEAPKPPPSPPEPPKAAAPPPPPPAPPTPPEQVKAPDPPPPLPKPEVKQPEPPKPKPPEPAPQQVQKPTPAPPQKKPPPPPDQLASLLKNLKQEKQQVEQKQQVAPAPTQPTQAPPQVASIDQRQQAQQLAAMVAQQIIPCWNVPAGARDARDMRVGIRITLNPDGGLRGIPSIQDQSRMASDGVFRAFAESGIRALQQCSPLRLPADKYALWQDMLVTFDPRDLVR